MWFSLTFFVREKCEFITLGKTAVFLWSGKSANLLRWEKQLFFSGQEKMQIYFTEKNRRFSP